MRLFYFYLNITLVSKINYLLNKTIHFFINQERFKSLGAQESLVHLCNLVSIIGFNKKWVSLLDIDQGSSLKVR